MIIYIYIYIYIYILIVNSYSDKIFSDDIMHQIADMIFTKYSYRRLREDLSLSLIRLSF